MQIATAPNHHQEAIDLYCYLSHHVPDGIIPFGKWLIGEHSDAYIEAMTSSVPFYTLSEQIWQDLHDQTEEENAAANYAWLRGYLTAKGYENLL